MLADQIPLGRLDDRSIRDIDGPSLAGAIQFHTFAGVGGWPLALKLAGWPEDQEVWTGSCPCQPFSYAGAKRGVDDERHLWPEFRRLIAERRPSVVFGEQVASAAGRLWLEGVRADMEALGYRFGAADLCSAGVGALDIRQRLYWVADTADEPRPQAGAALMPSRAAGAASVFDSVLRWAEMAAPDWQIPPSWVVRSIDGVPGRVGSARAFGNAVNPILASEFVMAYMDAR